MDPVLLLEALTKKESLPGVEEMLQRESQTSCQNWTRLPYFLLILLLISFEFIHQETILVEKGCRCKIHTLLCAHMLVYIITLIFGEEP